MEDVEESEMNEAVQNSHSNLESLASVASNQPASAAALPLAYSHRADVVRTFSPTGSHRMELCTGVSTNWKYCDCVIVLFGAVRCPNGRKHARGVAQCAREFVNDV